MTVANGLISRLTPRTMRGRKAVAGYIFISPFNFVYSHLSWFELFTSTIYFIHFFQILNFPFYVS